MKSVLLVGLGRFGRYTAKKLNELGEGAFAGCNSLEKVSISDKNKSFTVKDNLIYSKDYEALLSAAAASGEIRLSEETESIACRAFEGNSRVVTVRIPESVASIEECAFMSCSALETVILEGGMIEIDDSFQIHVDAVIEYRYRDILKLSANPLQPALSPACTGNEDIDTPEYLCCLITGMSHFFIIANIQRKGQNVCGVFPDLRGAGIQFHSVYIDH